MASDSTITSTSSSGISVSTDVIVSARRGNRVCREIPEDMAYSQESGAFTSIHKASSLFPVFYTRSGIVYIKPDPTTDKVGKVSIVQAPTISLSTSNTSMDKLENPMLLYAAALDCMALSGYWNKEVREGLVEASGDARDALDKAKVLIDDATSLSTGQDAEYWLNAEDPEMIVANLGIAQQEVRRALAEIEGYRETAPYEQSLVQKAAKLFDEANKQIQSFVGSSPEMIQLNAALQASQGGGR